MVLAATAVFAASCGKESIKSKGQTYTTGDDVIKIESVTAGYTKVETSLKLIGAPEGCTTDDLESLIFYISRKDDKIGEGSQWDWKFTYTITKGKTDFPGTITRIYYQDTTFYYAAVATFKGFNRALKTVGKTTVTTKKLPTFTGTGSDKAHPYIDLGKVADGGAGVWAWYDLGTDTPFKANEVSCTYDKAISYPKDSWGTGWRVPNKDEVSGLSDNCSSKVITVKEKKYYCLTSRFNNETIFVNTCENVSGSYFFKYEDVSSPTKYGFFTPRDGNLMDWGSYSIPSGNIKAKIRPVRVSN